MKASVIIAVYNKLENLQLILNALKRQSIKDFEVIVAEDNESEEIGHYLNNSSFPFNLKHVSQKDQGFRKNRILNKAIANSSFENILFLDGDCVPHKHFINGHLTALKSAQASYGRRVMLDNKCSDIFLRTNTISFYKILLSSSKKIKHGIYLPFLNRFIKKDRGLKGCNWAIKKELLETINGFDEDFKRATIGEDTDIKKRLLMLGVIFKPVFYSSITYHLEHRVGYSKEDYTYNLDLMNSKLENNSPYRSNGLSNHTI